jgi:hypothetical protein
VLLVDRSFPFLFLSFLLSRVHTASCSTTTLQARDTRRPTRPNHVHSRPHRLFPFNFLFLYSSRLALSDNVYPLPGSNRTLSFLCLFSLPFVYLHLFLFIPHHRNPRVRRYCTKTRHSRKAARMYTRIRQPACSSRRASRPSRRIISLPPSTLFPCVFSLPLGDRPVELLSTRSWPISRESLILSRPLFIPYSWTTFTLAAPIPDTIERTAKMCMRNYYRRREEPPKATRTVTFFPVRGTSRPLQPQYFPTNTYAFLTEMEPVTVV